MFQKTKENWFNCCFVGNFRFVLLLYPFMFSLIRKCTVFIHESTLCA